MECKKEFQEDRKKETKKSKDIVAGFLMLNYISQFVSLF